MPATLRDKFEVRTSQASQLRSAVYLSEQQNWWQLVAWFHISVCSWTDKLTNEDRVSSVRRSIGGSGVEC